MAEGQSTDNPHSLGPEGEYISSQLRHGVSYLRGLEVPELQFMQILYSRKSKHPEVEYLKSVVGGKQRQEDGLDQSSNDTIPELACSSSDVSSLSYDSSYIRQEGDCPPPEKSEDLMKQARERIREKARKRPNAIQRCLCPFEHDQAQEPKEPPELEYLREMGKNPEMEYVNSILQPCTSEKHCSPFEPEEGPEVQYIHSLCNGEEKLSELEELKDIIREKKLVVEEKMSELRSYVNSIEVPPEVELVIVSARKRLEELEYVRDMLGFRNETYQEVSFFMDDSKATKARKPRRSRPKDFLAAEYGPIARARADQVRKLLRQFELLLEEKIASAKSALDEWRAAKLRFKNAVDRWKQTRINLEKKREVEEKPSVDFWNDPSSGRVAKAQSKQDKDMTSVRTASTTAGGSISSLQITASTDASQTDFVEVLHAKSIDESYSKSIEDMSQKESILPKPTESVVSSAEQKETTSSPKTMLDRLREARMKLNQDDS